MTHEDQIVILVRHARTEPVPGVESARWRLAQSAREECRRLAAQLEPLHPDRIVTSDHHKAVATGSLLAGHLELACETAAGLQEHDRSGVRFFDDAAEWLEILRRLFERPDEVVLGNETANEALVRYEDAVRREVGRYPGERLIVVGHATVMALLVARHNDLDVFEFWQSLEMPEALVLGLPGFALLNRVGAGGASNRGVNR